MAKAAETQNVLDLMTQGIMGKKAAAAAKLTPVGAEQVVTHALPRTSAPFPNDQPDEAVLQAVVAIRRELAHIEEALAAVEAHLGRKTEVAETVNLDAQRKAREREADERAAERAAEGMGERIERLATEAQAAVFKREAVRPEDGDLNWTCPTHDQAEVRTSRKGRQYAACPVAGCGEFERL